MLAFILLVLPLFLLVCIQMINNSSWKSTVIGKILVILFYIAIISAIAIGVNLITSDSKDNNPTPDAAQVIQ